ncbi:MAG: dihydrofolate reductase family protein [Chitinophagaceae bacterium]|nr:dihydrofolate reductase family protein [Chitinophagaceae bacterium]
MRNLIYTINLTIDGCCDHIQVGIPHDDLYDYYLRLVQDTDAFVYGRKTYQLMVPYWPDIAKSPSGQEKTDIEFANAFVAVKKIIVFSKTLDKAKGENTEIVRTNLKDEILKLKQEQGKSILTGGVDLPSQLIQLGLVDEYRFVIFPVFGGKGKRLLENIHLQEKSKLKLVEARAFNSGAVALHYRKQ